MRTPTFPAYGFGGGPPAAAIQIDELASSTSAFREWRNAVRGTDAYAEVTQHGSLYAKSTVELLARSYEQYIALRSGDAVLAAKIERRRQDASFLYWSDEDFAPVAEAFDRLLITRGLRVP